MTTVVSILMSDIIPLRDRGVWQGIINIIYATGSGIGAPLGKNPELVSYPHYSDFMIRRYFVRLHRLEMVCYSTLG